MRPRNPRKDGTKPASSPGDTGDRGRKSLAQNERISAPLPAAVGAMLDMLPLPAWAMDAEGTLLHPNRAWREFVGDGEAHAAAGADWLAQLHPEDRQVAARALQAARDSGAGIECEVRVRHHSGGFRWCVARAGCWTDDDGRLAGWLGTYTDQHDRALAVRALKKSLELRDGMLDVSIDCIKIIDPQGNLVHMNRAGCLALGVPVDESRFGMEWLGLLSPEIRASGRRALDTARSGRNARFPGKSVLEGQPPQYWDNLLTPLKDADGAVMLILCVSRDVTNQREVGRRLRVASETDGLTQLLNPRTFRRRLTRVIGRAGKAGQKVGLILIDLDHFKHVNDTLGHQAGDHLLRTLAQRLRTCLPEAAAIGRMGGDEFAVVLSGVEDEQHVTAVASRMYAHLDTPVSYAGRMINGGMSMGCALFPDHARDASELIAGADVAMNDLKLGGRGGVRMFDREMRQAAMQAVEQLQRARNALRGDAIEPYYQPRTRLEDGRVIGFEALLRWHDDEGRVCLPGAIGEAFSNYSLATHIGATMQSRIFADMAAWRARGLPLLPVSLNAAAVEFLRGDYAENLLARMREFDIAPELVEIEIAEQVLFRRGGETIANTLQVLKSSGMRVLLDDFGTGHSSLLRLRDYPVSGLKIAPGFVAAQSSNQAVVRLMTELGRLLDLEVTAKGIETREQCERLRELGCRYGQGALLGEPVAADEAEGYLRRTALAPCDAFTVP